MLALKDPRNCAGVLEADPESDPWLADLFTDHLLVHPVPSTLSFIPYLCVGVFSYPESHHRLRRQEKRLGRTEKRFRGTVETRTRWYTNLSHLHRPHHTFLSHTAYIFSLQHFGSLQFFSFEVKWPFCFCKAVSEEVDDSLNDQWHMCELINLIVQPGKRGLWLERGGTLGRSPGWNVWQKASRRTREWAFVGVGRRLSGKTLQPQGLLLLRPRSQAAVVFFFIKLVWWGTLVPNSTNSSMYHVEGCQI